MPRPSAFDDMSDDEYALFSKEYERRRFKKVDSMVDWLHERGFDIGRSAVARQGVQLRTEFHRNLDLVKVVTVGAEMIAETTKDDNGKIADGLVTLVQGGLFDVLSNLSAADNAKTPEERLKLLNTASRAVADVARASVSTKKFRQQMDAELQRLAAAAEPVAKKAGLSDDDWAAIRAKFLGVEVASV